MTPRTSRSDKAVRNYRRECTNIPNMLMLLSSSEALDKWIGLIYFISYSGKLSHLETWKDWVENAVWNCPWVIQGLFFQNSQEKIILDWNEFYPSLMYRIFASMMFNCCLITTGMIHCPLNALVGLEIPTNALHSDTYHIVLYNILVP